MPCMEVAILLFHEIYGCYFRVVSAVLTEAVCGTLTAERLDALVREKAFAESVLTIPAALQNGEWPLLDKTKHTPLRHTPYIPLTTLQKRWLKALLLDPRIQLFAPSTVGLENVEPLFTPDMFVYFDRYADGDPFEDPAYIAHFKTVLMALREKRKLRVTFEGHREKIHRWICVPFRLEYSAKDDKFRLLTSIGLTINLARITECALLEHCSAESFHEPKPDQRTLVLELTDERNALERALLHFSHLEKETVRLPERRYQITLHYDYEDETELLIRVLSFGPMLRVVAPDRFISQIKQRLQRQASCELF